MNQKTNTLSDLKQIARQLASQRASEAEAAQRQNARRAETDANLFARAIGPVTPLRAHGRALHKPAPVAPVPRQRQRDERAALQQALSDEFDVSTLLQADEQLSFRRPGLGSVVTTKLRRGHWAVQREIDLHGLRLHEARAALCAFLQSALRCGVRCVRVVHGKGLGSPGRIPVLKNKVHGWLAQKKEVLAFVQAKPADGGAGALLVLLESPKRL
ncbi:MAG: Smr/MutS family protein [Burkholderiaceae bacterium]|nr:Smr/MutS family protein [Burkholderiaceae bacterium]